MSSLFTTAGCLRPNKTVPIIRKNEIMIIIIILLIFIVYMEIPNYYCRNICGRVTRSFSSNNEIALTFDDGPDRLYTLRLLQLLKKENVKATFFMVADKIPENMDIVRKVIEDGHTIGVHSMRHRSAWLSFPWDTWMDFRRALKIFDSQGIPVKFFRPPWGTFNLFTLWFAMKNGLKTVFWNVEVKDWSGSTSVDDIEKNLMMEIKPGCIVDLHDSGGADGAPGRTISALENVIPELKASEYQFISLDEALGGV